MATPAQILDKIANKTTDFGGYVREQTAIGEIGVCKVKTHNNRSPYAGVRLNWLLNNKRVSLKRLLELLSAA